MSQMTSSVESGLGPNLLPDAVAVERTLAGDRDAYRILVERHSQNVYRLAYRMAGNSHDAEEIVQEAFLRGYQKLKQFAGQANFGTWVYRIAANYAIDRLRQLGARQRLATGAAQEQTETVSDALSDTIKLAQRETVRRALAELPEEQKHTLVLAYFEGLTQSEIAAKLNAPLGTIKTRMRSGMIKLRALLGSQLENFG